MNLGWNLVFIKKQSKIDFRAKFKKINNSIFNLRFLSYLGNSQIFLYCKVLFRGRDIFVAKMSLLMQLRQNVHLVLYCLFFCWSLSFELIGYNFELRKSSRKNIIKFDLGFSRHWILITLPITFFLYGKRRRFTVFLSDPYEFFFSINFFRSIRHIFPYKKRGLLLEKMPKMWMKPGKRTKYR